MILTPAEWRALNEAAAFRLSGEMDDRTQLQADTLYSAQAKLAALYDNGQSHARLVALTPGEAKQACLAIGQMTDGNARDYAEWRLCTNGTRQQWQKLLSAEAALKEAT